MSARATQIPATPAQLGPYQLLAKIGEGGMGTVHLAKLEGLAGVNKLAVVKELRSELTGSQTFVQMFMDEARLAARLTHPNVVHTYGAGEDAGRLYLALEYLDGQPWSRTRVALAKRRALSRELHIAVLADVLSGLHYAHELCDYDGSALQVVHCDVSPQNVFVTYDGQVKLVDFGIARGIANQAQLAPGLVIGKLPYIAPEQARGEPVDRRADVFSIGVLLWEALAGRRFVKGKDWAAIRQRRADGEEPRAVTLAPRVPERLIEICDRALAFDPSARFATAAEFRAALLEYLVSAGHDRSHERLGTLVRETFAEDRARVHSLIEQHMKSPSVRPSAPRPTAPVALPFDPAEHTIKADLSELISATRLRNLPDADAANSGAARPVALEDGAAESGAVRRVLVRSDESAAHRDEVPPALPQRRLGFWAGAAVMLLTAAAFVLLAANPLPSSAAGVVSIPLPHAEQEREQQLSAASDPPPPAPATIELRIFASPISARLYLDGAPLPSNPYVARVPASRGPHVVRAVGRNLRTEERSFELDRDQNIDLKLAAAPAALAPAPPKTARPTRARTDIDVLLQPSLPDRRTRDRDTHH